MYSNRDFDEEDRQERARDQKALELLREIEERLELAIQAHSLYIENIEADPHRVTILSKKAALEYTLDILKDIKGE